MRKLKSRLASPRARAPYSIRIVFRLTRLQKGLNEVRGNEGCVRDLERETVIAFCVAKSDVA